MIMTNSTMKSLRSFPLSSLLSLSFLSSWCCIWFFSFMILSCESFVLQSPSSIVVSSTLKKSRIGSILYNNNINNDIDIGTTIGVGIDLGTTNSAIAFLDDTDNLPKIIEIPNNGRTIKSVVVAGPAAVQNQEQQEQQQHQQVEALIGKDALDWEHLHQKSAYRHVKRIMGTGTTFLNTEIIEVVPYISKATNTIDNDDDNDNEQQGSFKKKNKQNTKPKKKEKKPTLMRLLQDAKDNPTMLKQLHPTNNNDNDMVGGVGGVVVSPEYISSLILKKLIDVASETTQKTITRAVIGVPAYFNDAQREATIRAANLAGIEKVKLLREPEAAALAYGINKNEKKQKKQQQNNNENDNNDDDYDEELVLVFDLGGGTYDVSVLLIERGLTEIVCTSGDSQLGGANFDWKIAKYFISTINNYNNNNKKGGNRNNSIGCGKTEQAFEKMVRSAEYVRIYLSNNRVANLALPRTDEGWMTLEDPASVILVPNKNKNKNNDEDFYNNIAEMDSNSNNDNNNNNNNNNSTHLFCQFTRVEMEKICSEELQQLLRPIREVAVMAGVLLPGDASPSIVASALELDSLYKEEFDGGEDQEDFYSDDDNNVDDDDDDLPAELQNFRQAKKQQQKGRKKARQIAKDERKYRDETRKINERQNQNRGRQSQSNMQSPLGQQKIRSEGISGRPLSRVVLVGGATRMPAIGRIITALTGVVPQKTVDPDEAVALGCAVHVGVLDGKKEMGTVLNPLQAALLRAHAEKQMREGKLDKMLFDKNNNNDSDDDDDDEYEFQFDDDDDDEFGEYEIIEIM